MVSPAKKKPKVISLPGNYDKSLLTEDKPEPLDGQLQHAWNMLQAINKRLHKADQRAKKKKKVLKGLKKLGKGLY